MANYLVIAGYAARAEDELSNSARKVDKTEPSTST
jgi:hypothetical protein